MPSYTDSFHFPHHNAPLADLISPIHHLDDDDPSLALRTASADQFFLRAKDMGVSRRRTSTQFNEAFACDEFRMYDYKVRRCMRGRSHDWTDCPFAHPGEKARRRDPRKIHYSGVPCPDFRKGSCQRGDACEFAHGVFECWLHPARYRTQPCKDGKSCMRRVCFFAHSMQQLRYVAVPLEESLAERAIVDSRAHGLLPLRTHEDLGAAPGRTAYEHEVGLLSQENSDADFISAGTLSSNSGSGADSMLGMSAEDVYASVGSISETLAMLTLTSQNVSSLPFEVVNSMGLSSINTMGVPTEVHSPSLNIPPVESFASSRMGAIFQNDSLTDEWSSAPEILSSASSLQLYAPVVGSWSSSNTHTPGEHSSHMVESPPQQAAAWQNFLMHEGYSRGESTFSANADEFLDMVHHGGYGDAEMLHGYLNAVRRRRDANELNGSAKSMGLTDQWALLRRETCEFSSYNPYGSYGLSSPTSTLAAAPYPSPFSSPPLSPLSAPSIETCNVFSSRCHGNMQADDTGPMADIHIQNSRRMKELEVKHTFTNQQLPLDSHNRGQLVQQGNVKKALHRSLELPSVSECASGQNKWVAPCNNWNSEYTCKCDASSQQTFDDIHNRFGGDSAAENAMPDLGWVHELVM